MAAAVPVTLCSCGVDVYKRQAQSDTGNGTWLRADGHNYSTKLKAGKNEITVSYKDSKGEKKTKRYIITYEANKADERTPEIGENPPTIETNLDDWEGYIQQQNFTFLVKARTWQGEVIRSNHIRVTMDGQTIKMCIRDRYLLYHCRRVWNSLLQK